jgi:hypothetical protein
VGHPSHPRKNPENGRGVLRRPGPNYSRDLAFLHEIGLTFDVKPDRPTSVFWAVFEHFGRFAAFA